MMDYRSVKSRTDLEWSSLSENPSAVCGSGDLLSAGSGIFGIFQYKVVRYGYFLVQSELISYLALFSFS